MFSAEPTSKHFVSSHKKIWKHFLFLFLPDTIGCRPACRRQPAQSCGSYAFWLFCQCSFLDGRKIWILLGTPAIFFAGKRWVGSVHFQPRSSGCKNDTLLWLIVTQDEKPRDKSKIIGLLFASTHAGILATNGNGALGNFRSDYQDQNDPRPFLGSGVTGGLMGQSKVGAEMNAKLWNVQEKVKNMPQIEKCKLKGIYPLGDVTVCTCCYWVHFRLQMLGMVIMKTRMVSQCSSSWTDQQAKEPSDSSLPIHFIILSLTPTFWIKKKMWSICSLVGQGSVSLL